MHGGHEHSLGVCIFLAQAVATAFLAQPEAQALIMVVLYDHPAATARESMVALLQRLADSQLTRHTAVINLMLVRFRETLKPLHSFMLAQNGRDARCKATSTRCLLLTRVSV